MSGREKTWVGKGMEPVNGCICPRFGVLSSAKSFVLGLVSWVTRHKWPGEADRPP